MHNFQNLTDCLQYLIVAILIALAVAGLTHIVATLDPGFFNNLSNLQRR